MDSRYKTVFDLAADWGWQQEYKGFKLKGGFAVYTDALFNSRRNGANTLVMRLRPLGNGKVRQVGRYVPNSTEIELVK